MLGKFVGIDLGTTNSAVALAEEDAYGHLRVNALQISQVDNIVSNIESIKKYDTIPSVVYYKDIKGNVCIKAGFCSKVCKKSNGKS